MRDWGSWLDAPLARARAAAARGRLGHAFLVQGPPGWGQDVLAEALAREWLGDPPAAANARLAEVAHPDLKWIVPEGKGEQIRIDAVRNLAEFAVQTPQIAEQKVAVLSPADALNEQAANALLKTLEEPAGSTRLLLVTAAPTSLLPTLRSRCQRLDVHPAAPAVVLAWLRERLPASAQLEALAFECGSAPFAVLDAVDRAEEPIGSVLADVASGALAPLIAAQRLGKVRLDAFVARSMRYLSAALRARWGARPAPAGPSLEGAPVDHLLWLWNEHLDAAALCLGTGNPNPQLLVERLLFGWRRIVAGGAA